MAKYGIKAIAITVENTIVNQIQTTLLRSLLPTLTVPPEMISTTIEYLSEEFTDVDRVDTTLNDMDEKAVLFEHTELSARQIPIYDSNIHIPINQYINEITPSNYPSQANSYISIIDDPNVFKTQVQWNEAYIKIYHPVTSTERIYTDNINQLKYILQYMFNKSIIELQTMEADEYMSSVNEIKYYTYEPL